MQAGQWGRGDPFQSGPLAHRQSPPTQCHALEQEDWGSGGSQRLRANLLLSREAERSDRRRAGDEAQSRAARATRKRGAEGRGASAAVYRPQKDLGVTRTWHRPVKRGRQPPRQCPEE